MSIFRWGKAEKSSTTLDPDGQAEHDTRLLDELTAFLGQRRDFLFQEAFNVDNMEKSYPPGNPVVWGAQNELMGRRAEVELLGEFVAGQMVQASPNETAA